MAAYDYSCIRCGVVEINHPIKDLPKQECPKCNSPGLCRLVSLTSFSLKGGGWAKDAYSGQSNKKD